MREYLISEAMHALGVPTTRALAAVTTGEQVFREQPLPGAILTRVARSHLRVGTFQYFSVRDDLDAVKTLFDYSCQRLYPDARAQPVPALALLQSVARAQARLVAHWLSIGFIHGVMNTDNCAISGETIDYGPCAFLDEYDPAKVFSSIDRNGRYAYANQPNIAGWNLARLAETLLPLLHANQNEALEQANAALECYPVHFRDEWLKRMRAKLGLTEQAEGAAQDDPVLIQDWLDILQAESADFTVAFRALSHAVHDEVQLEQLPLSLQFTDHARFRAWAQRLLERLQFEPDPMDSVRQRMLKANPAFIPRNHQVQRAIVAAEQNQDFSVFEQLQQVLSKPFEEQPDQMEFQQPPRVEQRIRETFCGT